MLLSALLAATLAQAPDSGVDVGTLPFSPDSVKLVIEEAQPRIQECYEAFLLGLPRPVNGTLFTTFEIKADGSVTKAKVQRRRTTLRNRELHTCVTRVLSSLTFPKSKRNHPIEFPFNLKAQK